jgi:putative ATP-binding cassette transporter
MKLSRLLLSHGGWRLFVALGISALAGAALAALMRSIHLALTAPPADPWAAFREFAVLLAVYVVGKIAAQTTLADAAEQLRFELRLRILRGLLARPLRDLERTGFARLFGHVHDDVARLAGYVGALPEATIDLAVAAGCLAYMAFLSPPIFLFNLLFVGFAAACYIAPERVARAIGDRAAAAADRHSAQLDFALKGLAGLLLRRDRRREFLDRHFAPAGREVWQLSRRSVVIHIFAERFAEALVLLNVACLLFAARRFIDLPVETATGLLLAAIFVRQPLKDSLQIIPQTQRARIAAERLRASGLDLAAPPPADEPPHPRPVVFQHLRLEGVTFAYEADHGTPGFACGPFSFDLRPGEIVFVAGGNGSGKTTFAKLLCGLYAPKSGSVIVDGMPLRDEAARARQRALFAAVFPTDPLFPHVLGSPATPAAEMAAWLERLGLAGKVAVDHTAFSTVDLSEGQRRRLLLLNAILEDAPILLLDEWAADQDPAFREFFYVDLLPALRARGRTVVVVTHDDRYFRCADRLLRIEAGQLGDYDPPRFPVRSEDPGARPPPASAPPPATR